MKYLKFTLLMLFTVNVFSSFGQSDDSRILSKLKISKCIITAKEYNNGKETKKKIIETTYDENGNKTSFYALDSLGNFEFKHVYEIKNSGLQKRIIEYGKDGNIEHITVYLNDTINKIFYHFQLSENEDTLISQKWLRDVNGYDSLLFTKTNDMNSFVVDCIWNYDSKGNLLESNSRFLGKFTYKIDQTTNCSIEYNEYGFITGKTCRNNNEEVHFFYIDEVGYLYGITIVSTKGGRRIERHDNNGLVIEEKHLNKKGKILALITYEYI